MKVRALIDLVGTDIKSGEFFEASEAAAKGLVASGAADDKATEEAVYPDGGAPAAKKHPSLSAPAPEVKEDPKADPKATEKK